MKGNLLSTLRYEAKKYLELQKIKTELTVSSRVEANSTGGYYKDYLGYLHLE